MRRHSSSVLADEGGHDVDVVVGVPNCDPPDRVEVSARGKAELVDILGRDVCPLPIGQDAVGRGCTDRKVIHRLHVLADAAGDQGRV